MKSTCKKTSYITLGLLLMACAATDEIATEQQSDFQKSVSPPVISATVKSSKEVELLVSSASGDRIEIEKREGSSSFASMTILNAGLNKYSDISVLPKNTYEYRARAVKQDSNAALSEWSSVAQVSLPDAPSQAPDKPALPQVKPISSTSFEVVFGSYGPNTTSRGIVVTNVATNDSKKVNLALSVGTYLAENGKDGLVIAASTDYSVKVAHVNQMAESLSDAAAIKTLAAPLMAPPAPANVVGMLMGTNSIKLTWTMNNNDANAPSGYDFEQRTALGGFVPITVSQLDMGGKSAIVTGLSQGQYFYHLRAKNAAGASAFSAEAGATIPPPPPAPTKPLAPTSLLASKVDGKAEVTLTWVKASDSATISKMNIYRKIGAAGTYALHGASPSYALGTVKDMTSIAFNTVYCYQISVVNAANLESDRSNESCTTTDAFPLNPPTLSSLNELNESSSKITWTTPSTPSDFYEVWMGDKKASCDDPNPLSKWALITTLPSGTLTYTANITGVTGGETYCLAVRVKNVVNGVNKYSVLSNKLSKIKMVTTSSLAAPIITAMDNTNNQTFSTMSYAAGAGGTLTAESWEIWMAPNLNLCNLVASEITSQWTFVQEVPASQLYFPLLPISTVPYGGDYCAVVRAKKGFNHSVFSAIVKDRKF